MARLDRIKNLTGLVRLFGRHQELRELANLLVIGGHTNPDHSKDAEEVEQIHLMHHLFDEYELDGQVRWLGVHLDKQTAGELYRCVADRRGIFVQPALFEAFGLTVIEAMGSGLPTFATCFGGPMEIIENGISGFHIDPNYEDAIARTLADFFRRCAERTGLLATNRPGWDRSGPGQIHLEALCRTDDDLCPDLRILALRVQPRTHGDQKISRDALQPSVPAPGQRTELQNDPISGDHSNKMTQTKHRSYRFRRQALILAQTLHIDTIVVQTDCQDDFSTIRSLRGREKIVWLTTPLQIPNIPAEATDEILTINLDTIRGSAIRSMGLLLACLRGILKPDEPVLCLYGSIANKNLDSITLTRPQDRLRIMRSLDMETIGRLFAPDVFTRLVNILTRFSIEGREGKPIGTIFVLGNPDELQAVYQGDDP